MQIISCSCWYSASQQLCRASERSRSAIPARRPSLGILSAGSLPRGCGRLERPPAPLPVTGYRETTSSRPTLAAARRLGACWEMAALALDAPHSFGARPPITIARRQRRAVPYAAPSASRRRVASPSGRPRARHRTVEEPAAARRSEHGGLRRRWNEGPRQPRPEDEVGTISLEGVDYDRRQSRVGGEGPRTVGGSRPVRGTGPGLVVLAQPPGPRPRMGEPARGRLVSRSRTEGARAGGGNEGREKKGREGRSRRDVFVGRPQQDHGSGRWYGGTGEGTSAGATVPCEVRGARGAWGPRATGSGRRARGYGVRAKPKC